MATITTSIQNAFLLVLIFSAVITIWQIAVNGGILFEHWKKVSSETEEDKIIRQEDFAPAPTEPPKCSPKDRILFLKTHKTGSSTVTNILNRFGSKRRLSFALPTNEISFGWPHRFKTKTVIPLYSKPNIICNHARYNRIPMNYLFPKDISTYITILRNPLDQYESLFNFMKLWEGLNVRGDSSMDIMEKYLQNVTTFKSARLDGKLGSRLLRNPMLFDLGLDYRYYQDMTAVWKYLQFLEREFDLVLIMEHFDESVVLLKRMLCWDFDDIVFFKLNERQEKDKRVILKTLELNIRSWNQADFMLYNAFNRTLWKKIALEGPEFYRDLATFRQRQKEVFDMCVEASALDKAYSGKYVKGYRLRSDLSEVTSGFCRNITKNELKFMAENIQMQKVQQDILDDPGEFEYLFDKRNDWDVGKDLKHHPVA